MTILEECGNKSEKKLEKCQKSVKCAKRARDMCYNYFNDDRKEKYYHYLWRC